VAEQGPGIAAEQFCSAAKRHGECRDARVLSNDADGAWIELDLDVSMPTCFGGTSPNGVRAVETVLVDLRPDYPWSSPRFYLRQDFPRDLPHLQPGSADKLPRPCLIDGNQREYFFQFGLVELGVFNLIHQLVSWLGRAAEGTLIHHGRGWQPTLRHDLPDAVVVDADACRAAVERGGGYRTLGANYFRVGTIASTLGAGASAWLNVTQQQVPLKHGDLSRFTRPQPEETQSAGATVCCVVWPDKLPSGDEFVADFYVPETVDNFERLMKQAEMLGCARSLRVFFEGVERCLNGYILEAPIPVAVILCARRPCALEGSSSNIELLPYVVEIRGMRNRKSLLAAGDAEPVTPAAQIETVSANLLRSVSGAPETEPVAVLGCGSVGSKLAMHLARSGIKIASVSDDSVLRPHNMARHALARSWAAGLKSEELAAELKTLGQAPVIHSGDLVTDLPSRDARKTIIPKESGYAINTTASLGVREALSALDPKDTKARIAEIALFGRGEGAFLIMEGAARNPTLCDIVAEIYATTSDEQLKKLLFDPSVGLAEVQIGQGCGSLTMPMTDMRLSAMTAALAEEFTVLAGKNRDSGCVIIGAKDEGSPDTLWLREEIPPFEVVDIEGAEGWTVRIARRVADQIRADAARYTKVETGGALMGLCSARLKTVTVVDVIDAPPDSTRSAAKFVLGTQGLKKAMQDRHYLSGQTLFDVGTWHSHLADHGPSQMDRDTARQLASERPPPSVLLITSPKRLYALMYAGAPK
jgi:hypothetical protein